MIRSLFLALAFAFLLGLGACTKDSDKSTAPNIMAVHSSTNIHVMKVHANPAIQNTPSAVYMHLHNVGKEEDLLTGASSPVASAIEIHQSRFDNGMMIMERVQHILIPGGTDFVFKQGGYHLMLIGLKKDLVAGQEIELTLHFKRAGNIQLKIPVMFVAAGADPMHDHHMHH